MTRHLFVAIAVGAISVATPVRAAGWPHAGTETRNTLVWTNDNLGELHDLDPISVVGRVKGETSDSPLLPQDRANTRAPEWYAEQARRLQGELQRRKAQLIEYRQAIEGVENLKTMEGGLRLDEDDIGITPEAGIEILQQRLNETQADLDVLQDLARRHDIRPAQLERPQRVAETLCEGL
jgi:hypothetical protein